MTTSLNKVILLSHIEILTSFIDMLKYQTKNRSACGSVGRSSHANLCVSESIFFEIYHLNIQISDEFIRHIDIGSAKLLQHYGLLT